MDEISKIIYSKEDTAREKFDYFICSVAGALFAYIGQTYTPHKFDILIPLALMLLSISFASGLKRIYFANTGRNFNKQYVKESESCKAITKTLNEIAASKTPIILTDSTTGAPATPQLLESRRTSNLAVMEDAKKQANANYAKSDCWARRRDKFLFWGFILILLAKALQPYLKN